MAYRDLNATQPSAVELEFGLAPKATPAQEEPEVQSNFRAPGNVEDLDTEQLTQAWNKRVTAEYSRKNMRIFHSRFFALNHEDIEDGNDIDRVRWAAYPAEPNFCFDVSVAQLLSDWRLVNGHPHHDRLGVKGRRNTHNEYCEYKVIYRKMDDGTKDGKLLPKRVLLTTELREYWMLLAELAPDRLAFAAKDVLGRDVSWEELYGPGVLNPNGLSVEHRRILFATWVAGGAHFEDLLDQGVPTQPVGPLNNENALFMTHPINGLDDLLYIVLYGAHPYARRKEGTWVKATKDEIFSNTFFEEEEPPLQLACRHADPAAALGAAAAAFEGRTISFADPLGMYIQGFAKDDFLFQGESVPSEWIRFKRGSGPGFFQRLEFGPPDDSPHFLNEITVGDDEDPVIGGFQITQRIEVGPRIRVGQASNVSDTEYQRFEVKELEEDYNCATAPICKKMTRLWGEYRDGKQLEL